jgi:AraC-like DNA-binding protein
LVSMRHHDVFRKNPEMSTLTPKSRRRDTFFQKIDHSSRFFRLFDHLDGLSFFAKNADGALMSVDASLLQLYGISEELDIVGKTDFDLLPRSLAEKYRRDDVQVMETREPLLNMVELFPNSEGVPGWFRTNKLPIYSTEGDVIGVMGTIQVYDNIHVLQGVGDSIRPALSYIDEHFRQPLSIAHLADLSGVSVRQLERSFRRHFDTPPQQFIAKRRVYEACVQLRQTDGEISELALGLGFYDQSSFTRQFRKHMGITPLQYRRKYQ